MNLTKNSKGITLIALVITIIVLLILAGVSIAMLTGENGILTQAQRAKTETENSAQNEASILDDYEDYLNKVTGDVPQVNDSNPGVLEGNGTEQEPYTINSIEDLVFFADSVTNGNNYEGEYVKLNQSLDFKSDKSYVDPNRENYYGYTGKLKEALTTGEGFEPIGTPIRKDNNNITDTTNNFCGYFDGNGKKIINCYMNKDVSNLETAYAFSFFGAAMFGEIKNFGIENVNFNLIANEYESAISGMCGINFGNITNCYVAGNITATQEENGDIYCTGIAKSNRGTIENSYNLANINLFMESDDKLGYCAGVVSNSEFATSIIRNCYNAGNITAEINSGYVVQMGGIVRSHNLGTVENCYNNGNLNCKVVGNITGNCVVGGDIGYIIGGNVRNIYNSGDINIFAKNKTVYGGGVGGYCRRRNI